MIDSPTIIQLPIWKFYQYLKLNTRNLTIPLSYSYVSSMTQTTCDQNQKILFDSMSSSILNHVPNPIKSSSLLFPETISRISNGKENEELYQFFFPPALTKNCSLVSEMWGGKTAAKRKRRCQRRKRWHKVCSNRLHGILSGEQDKSHFKNSAVWCKWLITWALLSDLLPTLFLSILTPHFPHL